MNWKQNKVLFNYIINKKYTIKKNDDSNDILYISWDKIEMKCKYFLAFTINELNEIIWSCDNPYIDQKTKYLSNNIKKYLNQKKTYSVEVLNNLKKIIQKNLFLVYEEEKINLIWCLIGNNIKYKQFYIITEIIYI